jgi:hypothetical protein
VEQPVRYDQEANIISGGLRTAQQMVPLQNLVKKDAVKETTQTETKGSTAHSREPGKEVLLYFDFPRVIG